MIPLTIQFIQSLVSEQVFERGKLYYEEERVRDFNQTDNSYFATVCGTQNYQVKVWWSSCGWDARCSCPYDWENFCKHIVAVMLKIVEKEKQTSKEKVNDRRKGQTSLKEVSSLAEYKSLVRSTIHGFVEWDKTYQALQGAYNVMGIGDSLYMQKNFSEAIITYQAIFEVLIVKILHADDSDGSFGEVIDQAFEGWVKAVFSLTVFDEKKHHFDYALSKGKDDDWSCNGFDDELLSLIVEKTEEKKDCQYVLLALEKLYGENYRPKSDYDFGFDFYLSCKAKLLQKTGDAQTYELFSLNNLHNVNVLMNYLNYLISQDRLGEAIKIGEEQLENILPGYKPELMEILLQMYSKLNLLEKQKEALLFLYIEKHDETYYDELKKLCNKDKSWNHWRDRMIQRFLKNHETHRLVRVFMHEDMTEALIKVGTEADEEYILEPIADYLAGKKQKDSFKMYKKLISCYLNKYTGRSCYHQAARWMRRMKKLGFDEEFSSFISKLRELYKKRPALLEEMTRF